MRYEPLPEYAAGIGMHARLPFPVFGDDTRQRALKDTDNGQFVIRQSSRKMGPFPPYAAADIAGATAFERGSVIRISRHVSRRCARVGFIVGALCACGKEGPIGTATRGRTGPATHTPKSLASGSWPSRPYRASGQPSCGKRLPTHTRAGRHRRLKRRGRRRCVQESAREPHCEERRRHSALEPISKQSPAAQRLWHKLAEAII